MPPHNSTRLVSQASPSADRFQDTAAICPGVGWAWLANLAYYISHSAGIDLRVELHMTYAWRKASYNMHMENFSVYTIYHHRTNYILENMVRLLPSILLQVSKQCPRQQTNSLSAAWRNPWSWGFFPQSTSVVKKASLPPEALWTHRIVRTSAATQKLSSHCR